MWQGQSGDGGPSVAASTRARGGSGVSEQRADAIAVLGCRVLGSGRPTAAAARRAAAAAEAYHAGVASCVVASGGRRHAGQIEARVLRRELLRAGVPDAAIVEELSSLSTRENAAYVAEIVRRRGGRTVAVVTCDWHLPRALANFRRAGMDPMPWPAPAPPHGLLVGAMRILHELVSSRLEALAGPVEPMPSVPSRGGAPSDRS
jgi:uncharacterized SAM-binding protein YcdF (DUF218 family)